MERPSQTPWDLTPQEQAPQQRGAEYAFLENNVEDLRARQQDILNDDSIEAAEKTVQLEALIGEYLNDFGVADDADNRASYESVLRAFSADRIPTSKWRFGEWNAQTQKNEGKTGRDLLYDKQEELFGRRLFEDELSNATQLDGEATRERDAEFERLEAEVVEAREKWAAASAKRQGRLFSLKDEKRDVIRDDYFAKVAALGARHMQEHPDYSDEDKDLISTTIIFDEQEKLRNLTIEKLEDKKVSKIIKWMNKGKWYTRIGKGIAVGTGAGLAGSFLAGAIGAGIVAGGAVAATRFARGFALKDHDKRGMDRDIRLEDDVLDADGKLIANMDVTTGAFDDASRFAAAVKVTKVHEQFEADTKLEQQKRWKAVKYGVGSMAIGSALGYGIHAGAEWLADKNLTLLEYAKDKLGFGDGTSSRHAPGANGESGTGTTGDTPDTDGDGVIDSKDSAPNDPNTWLPNGGNESVFDPSEVVYDARWVEPGEGWYQTFHELGIPQNRWDETLQLAGPKLHEQGWSYFDESANEWRISQPGRLSDEALSTIAGSAKQAGYNLAA